MIRRLHRNEEAYPALWRAVDGAIRDAVFNHPDIVISDRRRASVVKRIVGAVLASKEVKGGLPPSEMPLDACCTSGATGVQLGDLGGAGHFLASPQSRQDSGNG